MSCIGIVVAVRAEARSLGTRSVRKGKRVDLADGAMLSVSGMGPRQAALASRTLLENGATALLSWGIAGGLSPKLSSGSLILPKTVVASNQFLYHVDATWHKSFCNRLKGQIDFYTEPMVESTRIVRTPAEKAILFRETGAIGVDMESAALAAVAQEARVPFLVVRAVADSADTTIPDSTLKAVDECGRFSFSKLIWGLAGHPAELFPLVRIARDYRAAQRTLAAVAHLVGNSLVSPQEGMKDKP